MSYKIGDLIAVLSLDDKMSSGLTKAGDKLQKFGAETMAMSVAIAGVGTASVMASAKFDQSLTKMVALAGVSQKELAGVRQHILDLAPAIGIGPQALADAFMVVSSVTDDTATALQILDQAAVLSASGMGEAKDTAKALTAIINAYGKENITAAQAADILTQTVKDGGAEATELAPILANVIPMAAQLGISFQEVGANIATVTKLGTPAAEAVTQLTAVMTALLKPTNDGEKALASIGMTYEQLRNQVANEGLQKALVDLVKKFGDNKTALADVFGRVEALRNIMGTAGQQAEVYAQEIDSMTNAAGAGAKAQKIMGDTTAHTWAKLTASVEVAAIEFGNQLAPSLDKVMKAAMPLVHSLVKAIDTFGKMPQPVQTTVIGLLSFGAVLGPLSYAIGNTVSAVGVMSGVLLKLGPVIGSIATGSIPILTGGIGSLTAASLAAAPPLTALMSVMAAAAVPVALATAIGLTVKQLADEAIANDTLKNQENAAIARNAIIIANLEKHRKAGETLAQTNRRLAEEQKKLADAAKKVTEFTGPQIAAMVKAAKAAEDMEKASKLVGKAVTDPKVAASILATAKAQEEAAKRTEEWAKKAKDAARDLEYWTKGIEALKKQAVELPKILKSGPLIPILTPGNQGPDELLRRLDFANALKPNLPTDEVGRLIVYTGQATKEAHKLREAWLDVAGVFLQMGQEIGGWAGTAISAVGLGIDAWQNYGTAVTKAQKIAAAAYAAQAAMDIYTSNKENLNGGQAAMSGAAKGASAGAAFGVYGVVIGAIAGAAIGFFSGSGFRAMAKQAGDVLGVEMTQGLAKAVKETMKAFHTDVKSASLLNLDKAIQESGRAASTFGPQLTQLFDLVKQGGAVGTEAIQQLDSAFGQLASEGTPRAARAIADLIKQGMGMRELTNNMMSFVNDALAGMAAGADKILEGLSMIDKDVPLGEMGTAAAQMFVAGFTAEIAQKGIVEAISGTGDKISELYAKLVGEGNTTAAAMLEPFAQLSTFINDEANTDVKGFLTTLQGMGEVFAGLDKVGFVTQDAFNGLQTGIEGTANALDEAGVKGQAYYMALAPQLAQILQAHEKYGMAIDEETQGLIDQAQAAGITFAPDPMQMMIDLLGRIVVLMGGELPASMSTAAEAAATTGDQMAESFGTAADDTAGAVANMADSVQESLDTMSSGLAESIADTSDVSVGKLGEIMEAVNLLPDSKEISVKVNFRSGGMPRNDDGSIDFDGDPSNSFSGGTKGFRNFGGGTPSMLHGEEIVATRDQMDAIIATALKGGASTQSQGDTYLPITINLPGDVVLQYLEKATKRGEVRLHENAVKRF